MNLIEEFISRHKLIRRGTVVVALVMTWRVTVWSMWFAADNARNGMEIAAILAAIQAPITLFTSMVFKSFVDSKEAT